jgi:hypothetical protein
VRVLRRRQERIRSIAAGVGRPTDVTPQRTSPASVMVEAGYAPAFIIPAF